MNFKLTVLLTLFVAFFNNVAYAQSQLQFNRNLQDRAYNFCPRHNFNTTEAYMETNQFTIAVCSNYSSNYDPQIDTCPQPFSYFIVVKPKTNNDNQVIRLTSKLESNGKYYPDAIYTFVGKQNDVVYQIQTTGGSNSYHPDDFEKHYTFFSMIKGDKVIYQEKVNYYFGSIGMGC